MSCDLASPDLWSRRRVRGELPAMAGVRAIGLDMGATKTLGVLIDADGRVLEEVEEPTRRGAGGVVNTAEAVVAELVAAGFGMSTSDSAPVSSVGIGIPGLVDVERGAVRHAVNLGVDHAWVPLRDKLEARLSVPVVIENDVNVATFGAASLAAIRDLAYISIGTGLAAGVVLGGTLHRGATGAAGEIGHVPSDPQGALCHCGQRGCLETLASGRALAKAWPSASSTARRPAQALFDAAAAGNARAVEIRDRFAAAVAEVVRMLCLSFDPEKVVLGGGVAQLGAPLVEAVVEALRAQAASSPFLTSLALGDRVRLGRPDLPVAAIGAALLGRP